MDWRKAIYYRQFVYLGRRGDLCGEVAAVAVQIGRGADLDLEVAGGELQRAAALADQHVGQDRQRVPALDDARDRLQHGQHFFLGRLQDDHWITALFNLVVVGKSRLWLGIS